MALGSILQLLRPQTLEDERTQRAYQTAVERIASRLGTVLEDWIRLREVEADNMRLANAAAVNRWELMRMAGEADQLEPPGRSSGLHREVHDRILAAARACQLLANGYRFYKYETVCDGQALLIETVETISGLAARLQMRL